MSCKILLNIGFAGSGKSTFTSTCFNYLSNQNKKVYIVNLDPAVKNLPFSPNLDIRDTINYKDVMESYKLGPNGAITTCLNIFVTKIDQIVDILTSKRDTYDYILIDVPGQIEAFTWSVSGEIIFKALKKTGMDIDLYYIMDAHKCVDYSTFVSNMLYSCNVVNKLDANAKLIFNKSEYPETCNTIESYIKNEIGYTGGSDGGYGGSDDYYKSLLEDIHDTFESLFSTYKRYYVSSTRCLGIQDLFTQVL